MWSLKNLLFVLVLGVSLGAGVYAADKVKLKSDKERIEYLEKDLAGEHLWADEINQSVETLNARSQWLHEHVLALENHGPVAKEMK